MTAFLVGPWCRTAGLLWRGATEGWEGKPRQNPHKTPQQCNLACLPRSTRHGNSWRQLPHSRLLSRHNGTLMAVNSSLRWNGGRPSAGLFRPGCVHRPQTARAVPMSTGAPELTRLQRFDWVFSRCMRYPVSRVFGYLDACGAEFHRYLRLIANITRCFFWLGEHFELPLLAQSILMIFAQVSASTILNHTILIVKRVACTSMDLHALQASHQS